MRPTSRATYLASNCPWEMASLWGVRSMVTSGPSKSTSLSSVRRAATGCTVLRFSTDSARREDRFYTGIDRPTQRGCTFDGTAGLQ